MIAWILIFFLNAAMADGVQFSDLPKVEYSRNPFYESEGFRLGFILDFHREGLILWSYEGSMMIGYGSNKTDFVDPYCYDARTKWLGSVKDEAMRQKAMESVKTDCYVFTNPWPFSTMNGQIYKEYQSLDNAQFTPVVLYYVTPTISPTSLITNTKNFVEGIYAVNPTVTGETSYTLPDSAMPIAGVFNWEKGFIDGRIVKASLDHLLRKSFEVIVQEGGLGSNFRRMSVSDQRMFDFIVQAMLTGKLVRIGYVELFGIEEKILKIGKDYDSPFRIYSLEIRGQAPSAGLPDTLK